MKKAIKYAVNTGCRFVKIGTELNRWKSNMADSAEDVSRAARKARHAAEDFLDDAATVMKKQPLKSAGIAFGVGIGVGAVAGWLGTRK